MGWGLIGDTAVGFILESGVRDEILAGCLGEGAVGRLLWGGPRGGAVGWGLVGDAAVELFVGRLLWGVP